MKLLKWFYPGMKIKRWIALAVFGVIMLSMGFVIIISEEGGKASFSTSLIIIIGTIAIITGVKRIINSLITIFLPGNERDLVDIVYKKRQLEKGQRIVFIGSGKGLGVALRGVKEHTSNITAILTVVDEGLISGRVEEQFGIPQPSDIRDCLIALADAESTVEKLFHYRFKKGTELWGHNFGDLFLAAMSEIAGDFEKAVKESSRVLATRGIVALSTLTKVSLIAHHQDGTETVGRQNILSSTSPIKRVYLRPQSAKATKEAVDAILKADAIVFGPASLYTGIIPGLLIEGIKDAIAKSKAVKIYILSIMTKAGETDNYKASDHLRAINEHLGLNVIDYCIVNKTEIPKDKLRNYEQEAGTVVEVDKEALAEFGCEIIESPTLSETGQDIRHDPFKLADAIFGLLARSKKVRPHAK